MTGTTDAPDLQAKRDLLERLLRQRAAEPLSRTAGVDGWTRTAHPFGQYVNPHLSRVLYGLGLDKSFVRGDGCWLFDADGRKYLDFTAAYGALPFGFNPPAIWEALQEAAANFEVSFAQPSLLDAAGALAARLIELAPPRLRYVTFANSGAESVEVAIKLARAATGRAGILATHNAFHGKTLAALSATGRVQYQRAFGAPAAGFEHIPYGDMGALAEVLKQRADQLAAFIVEPIQGEGGIVVPPPDYLRRARELCSRYGVLLIFDEVQTGLGRTGYLFACQHSEVSPDILTLAKALGGGVMPLAAVLCTAEVYTEEFALKHTSTFANNGVAARVGLRTLELLTRDDQRLVRHVADNGTYLKRTLEQLQRAYPRLVHSVRGRGFLLGVEFTSSHTDFGRQCLLASLAEQEGLVPAVCSYMLDAEGIRLAPTVLGASVMRVEPPLIATHAMCASFAEALERTLSTLQRCETTRVFSHLVRIERPLPGQDPPPRREVALPSGDEREGRWAFLVHPLDDTSYRQFDAGLECLSDEQASQLAHRLDQSRFAGSPAALVMGAGRLVSATGATAFGEILALPFTADELLSMPLAQAVQHIGQAAELAKKRGARILGLGAYTSVVTKNALYVQGHGLPVTTGNSYTVVSAIESVRAAARGWPLTSARVAIVGAAGSIARSVARMLAGEVGSLVLIGNPAHRQRSFERLLAISRGIIAMNNAAAIGACSPDSLASAIAERLRSGLSSEEVLDSLQRESLLVPCVDLANGLADAHIVVTATSSPRPLVQPHMLKHAAVVCDVSRPSNVSSAVARERPDVTIVDSGIVELPRQQDLGIAFGLESGLAYACMAETMLLALEGNYDGGSIGDELDEALVRRMQRSAERHGFRHRSS